MASLALPAPDRLIEALEAANRRLVLVTAGGGSAAIAHLATTPGASEILLEATVASARSAVNGLLGGPQEAYCSSRTARRLAVAAWERARLLLQAEGVEPAVASGQAVGLAVTAGLATRRPRRGEHRAIVAVQTRQATQVAELVLEKGARSRAEEELNSAWLVLSEVAAACGAGSCATEPPLRGGDRIHRDAFAPPEAWQDLFAGTRAVVAARGGADTGPAAGGLVFPGSFDPLHEGHLLMARIAEEIAERPLAYEISIHNVDKPPLDFIELRDRAAQFAERPLWFTRAATFLEKLDVFPATTFVLGADTYARLPDPRYYGGSAAAATRAVKAIASRSRGLIVFGRLVDGVFHDAASIEVPQALRDVTYFVTQREFRLDISSTDLRRQARVGAEG